MTAPQHVPVMTREVVALLRPERGGLYVDCTVGLGGHARALLEAGAERLIGLDRDPDALAVARETLAPWSDRIELEHADYRDLPSVLTARGITGCDGALADLGVSSLQLDARRPRLQLSPRRAVGHAHGPEPGTDAGAAAARHRRGPAGRCDLSIRRGAIFASHRPRHRDGSRRARRWKRRDSLPTSCAVPCRGRVISASTRRRERFRRCASWSTASSKGWTRSSPVPPSGCWPAPVSRSSVFTRSRTAIVKHGFRALERAGAALRIVTKRPLMPSEAEVEANPRARSAKLRAIERLA